MTDVVLTEAEKIAAAGEAAAAKIYADLVAVAKKLGVSVGVLSAGMGVMYVFMKGLL